jgi:glycosyltransferase involved in cell wall biosynthesis
MRIAQIAPLAESVPPKFYGGTERIVSWLTEELVAQGHEVTLFASGDSLTSAELVPCAEQALRLNPAVKDTLPYHIMMLEKIRQRADEFDVVHFHIDMFQYPLIRELGLPAVTTMHGRLDLHDLQVFFTEFSDAKLVSISDHQRLPMPPVDWLSTIHHGLPPELLQFNPAPRDGGYLAFLGRISPEKRPDRAIEIATRLKQKLKIAAKVDKADKEYWDEIIEPMVRGNPYVEFIGEIGEAQKSEFLGNARALLFPIDWPEPFGIVMIEAMACGTPVMAYRCGSVPEVIEHGVSGWIVDDMDGAIAAISGPNLDRRKVRDAFEARFTARRMAQDYIRVYEEVAAAGNARVGGRPSADAQRLASMPAAAFGDDASRIGLTTAIHKVEEATAALRDLS